MKHFLVLIVALATACSWMSPAGNPRIKDPHLVAQIHEGQTTKADVEELFGEPDLQFLFEDGGECWHWAIGNVTATATPGDPGHTLTIWYDAEGIVTKFDSRRAGEEPSPQQGAPGESPDSVRKSGEGV